MPVPVALPDVWCAWLTENLLRGVPHGELVQLLGEEGFEPPVVEAAIATVTAHPIFEGAGAAAKVARRALFLARTRRRLATCSAAPVVERRSGLSPEAFYAQYYARHRPVILTDLMTEWPARTGWTPEAFKARFDAVPVDVQVGRRGTADERHNPTPIVTATTMGAYCDRVRAATGPTNDFYMVATCQNLEKPELRPLLDEVQPLPGFLNPEWAPDQHYMWFGPGGTVTPLHHDQSNILHALVYGKKRFWLVDPNEMGVFTGSRGLYAEVDLEDVDLDARPDLAEVTVHQVDLHAGEAIFLPVAWWHQVRTLEPSIGIAFTRFTETNEFPGGFDTLFDAPLDPGA